MQSGFGRHPTAEIGAVHGLADGGRGGDEGIDGPHPFQHGSEAAQAHHGHLDAFGRQSTGRRQIASEAGENLFVEHGPNRAAF